MLSTFDAKSRTSTKQLKEQLHQGWPVSNSAVAIEQLGKELRDEMKQSLEVVSGRPQIFTNFTSGRQKCANKITFYKAQYALCVIREIP